MEKSLEIYNIEFSLINKENYKPKKNAKLVFDKGDFILVTGNNAVGKSTFLIALFAEPHSGQKWWDIKGNAKIYGIDILRDKNILDLYSDEDKTALRANICYVEQEDSVPYGSKVYDYLVSPTQIYIEQLPKNIRKEYYIKLEKYANEYIEKYLSKVEFNIKKIKSDSIKSKSGGQKKLLHILAWFLKIQVLGLKFLIMDEPLNNLDAKNKKLLNTILTELRKNNPELTIFIVTHCRIFDGINKELHISEDGFMLKTDNLKVYDCLKDY